MKNTKMIDNPGRLDLDAAASKRPGSRPPHRGNPGATPARPPGASVAAGPAPTLRWLGSSILRGCNIHHDRTVLRITVDLGVLQGRSSASAGPDFADRFIARFYIEAQTPPTAADDRSFHDALRSARGVPFEEVLLQAILAVERRLAFARNDYVPIGMASVEPIDAQRLTSQVRLVWESSHPAQSRAAARLALAGVLALLPTPLRADPEGAPSDFEAELAALLGRARRHRTSASTSVVALAAHARGIPRESLGGPYLQLGHGAAQRMLYSSVPAEMPLTATLLSRNKRKSTQRLAQLGLPVTRQVTAASAEQALVAATKLGYPVVVKPLRGKQGSGVSVSLTRDDEVSAAFERASQTDSRVLVEDFVPGTTFRLLVIGGRFVAAVEITVPTVVGDGTHRIEELIQAMNQDPMRNGVRLQQLVVDADLRACLARSGHTLADVPKAGREIALRTAANVSLGGVGTDVTDRVHISHRELAERAAEAIGLSVAGIDVVSPDIGRPCAQAGTRIIEVNARPGLDLHVFPRHGRVRDVGGAMVEQMFPPGTTGQLPTALVLGRRGARAVARELDTQLREHGRTTGLVTRKAAFVGSQTLAPDLPMHEAVAMLQRDPRMQALVVATTPRDAVAHGLALESADVVALLAGDGHDDAQDDAQAVALALRVARRAIVVEADNRAALRMLQKMIETGTLERKRLILVGTRLGDPVVDAHVAAGGTAVLGWADAYGERIVVSRHDGTVPVQRSATTAGADRPGRRETRARVQAAALAWALDLPAPDRAGSSGSAAVAAVPTDTQENKNTNPRSAEIPWQGPNRAAWLEEVQAWLKPRVERQGQQIVGPLHCVRDRPWAIVLRVPCSRGPLFFKALAPDGKYELAIMETLGPRWNDRLPTVLASEPRRGWVLMEGHGRTLREHLGGADSTNLWLQLLPKFAQMQMIEMPWRAMGVPDRRPRVLPAQFRALLGKSDVLRLGQVDGLSHERLEELHKLLPEFDACCDALTAHAPTINHGDLHDRNVLVHDGHYRFIDFGDAEVSHPLGVLLMPCQKNVPAWFSKQGRQQLRRMCGAYLDAWRDHRDAATLRSLLGPALWVAHVARALAWEELVGAARGRMRREGLDQVSSWLNIFAKRRVLSQLGSF